MTAALRNRIDSWIEKFEREEGRLPMCKEIAARWGISYGMSGRIVKEYKDAK